MFAEDLGPYLIRLEQIRELGDHPRRGRLGNVRRQVHRHSLVVHHCVGVRLVLLGGAAQPFGRILPPASTAAWLAKLAEQVTGRKATSR